jgi:hypothetical protein
MTCPPDEVWETIVDFPDYEISNHGRIISYRCSKARLLKASTLQRGYKQICLKDSDDRQSLLLVHRLVARHFLPPPREDQKEVDHIDRNPSNNIVTNLRWSTRSANMRNTCRYRTDIEVEDYAERNRECARQRARRLLTEKIECPCGKTVSRLNYKQHCKSQKHIDKVDTLIIELGKLAL